LLILIVVRLFLAILMQMQVQLSEQSATKETQSRYAATLGDRLIGDQRASASPRMEGFAGLKELKPLLLSP
jgi:hypothetical protein